MMLSIFKGYADTMPVAVSLDEVVRLIREDKVLADHTEKYRYYRSQGQKTAANREKAACPCFAVAVRFDGGKRRTDISGWTGLSMVDFDHLPEGQAEVGFRKSVYRPAYRAGLYHHQRAGGEGGVPLLSGWRDARYRPGGMLQPGIPQGERVLWATDGVQFRPCLQECHATERTGA